MVLAAVGLAGCDASSPRHPVSATSSETTEASGTLPTLRRPAPESVAGLLVHQAAAVRYGDERAWLSTWSSVPTAERQARVVWHDLTALQINNLRAHVAAAADASPPPWTPGGRWHVDVAMTWTAATGGASTSPATNRLRYDLALHAGRPVVVGLTAIPGMAAPIWSLGPMVVRRGPRTLVVASTAAGAGRVSDLLRLAVGDVNRVLPGWHGRLVAYLPAGKAEFDALVGANPGQYAGIAAVTTTVDGSRRAAAPVAIVLNPPVFVGLGAIGAHVVVTHEATHMATGVAVRPMPPWVAEGFADYVAIGSVHVPVSESAARAIHAVRTVGVPAHLPGSAAFSVAAGPLEAVYEEAWFANRLIARDYGQARLVAFYRAVRSRPHQVAEVFERVLHTSVRRFTTSWRRALVTLADR